MQFSKLSFINRILLINICFIQISFLATAQKVDLDRYHFNISYRAWPTNYLGSNYISYNVQSNVGSSIKAFYTPEAIADAINLELWKKVNTNGDLTINIFLDDLVIERSEQKSRQQDVKDKDGKVTGSETYYWVEMQYSYYTTVEAIDNKKQQSIQKLIINDRATKMTWKSGEYKDSKQSADYYNNNRYGIKEQLIRTLTNNALITINNNLRRNYAFISNNTIDILWVLNNSKHPEHEAQQAVWEKCKQTIQSITSDSIAPSQKSALLQIVQYFDSVKVRFTSTEKADKKMRYGAYYNNAKIYYYLDMPDMVDKEADGLIANDYDKGDGRMLKNLASELRTELSKPTNHSRHYTRNIDIATTPTTTTTPTIATPTSATVATATSATPNVNDNSSVTIFNSYGNIQNIQGWILLQSGDTIKGSVSIDFFPEKQEGSIIDISVYGRTVNITYQNNKGKTKNSSYKPKEVKCFFVGTKMFEPIILKPTGLVKAMNILSGDYGSSYFMEKVYATNTCTLLYYVCTRNYVLKKASDNNGVYITDILQWNKPAKIFCETLKEKVSTINETDPLKKAIQVADLYTKTCK